MINTVNTIKNSLDFFHNAHVSLMLKSPIALYCVTRMERVKSACVF